MTWRRLSLYWWPPKTYLLPLDWSRERDRCRHSRPSGADLSSSWRWRNGDRMWRHRSISRQYLKQSSYSCNIKPMTHNRMYYSVNWSSLLSWTLELYIFDMRKSMVRQSRGNMESCNVQQRLRLCHAILNYWFIMLRTICELTDSLQVDPHFVNGKLSL